MEPSANLEILESEVTSLEDDTTSKVEKNPPDVKVRNIKWVSRQDFTVEVGAKQIRDYIRTWELQPCWIFSLDYLFSTEEGCHTFYHYTSRWSTPSPRRPIRGTASVHFIVDVSSVEPQISPVDVQFYVESNRLRHTAGKTRFREKWLTDVIESKAALHKVADL
ncbi:A-kinase anchor protein 14 [Thalassophryne amazonica]|uniref:A-kinase anchor protein 14 n=1 Tax=Thalassophryne amazonica TaxID=390379 RepID=UPI0014713FB4|nr:A-kinase anchor protein 14 [Thalassophryne amazonica]